MNEEINDLLNEEIKSHIDLISNMGVDEEYYSKAIDGLVKLHKLRIEESRMISEAEDRMYKREIDEKSCELQEEIRQEQLSEQKKERYIRTGLDVAGLLVPILFYSTWMRKGFKFEETGTFTSTTFRNLFGHFRPTKR